jgi:hypothetical protein
MVAVIDEKWDYILYILTINTADNCYKKTPSLDRAMM